MFPHRLLSMFRNPIRLAVLFLGVVLVAPARCETPPRIGAYVETHCLDCHSGEDSEAGFDSPFLYLALKEGTGNPIVGRRRDETFENWPGDFSQRMPGFVLNTASFINAVGVPDHRTRALGKTFKATAAGKYIIRVGAFAYQSDHGQVKPTKRTEVVAFYAQDRLLGTVDVDSEGATAQRQHLAWRAHPKNENAVRYGAARVGDGLDASCHRVGQCSHLAFDRTKNEPLANVFVSMLQRMGIETERFASSTGTIRGLGSKST